MNTDSTLDDCYIALDVSRPFKSLDFGIDGYTASVTSKYELLQLTAPDDECGIVFVRGDFPDSAESILGRTQRRNQKGTWGLAPVLMMTLIMSWKVPPLKG
jgi:hypothetical protein